MKPNLLMTIILPQLMSCQTAYQEEALTVRSSSPLFSIHSEAHLKRIEDILTPPGYHRRIVAAESFPAWLRTIPLKNDNRVFLYNGVLKRNQSAQFAVLDIPVGKKDLQQCADAVMRLRAQFLFDKKRLAEISFADNNAKKYEYLASGRLSFDQYLERVFAFCGTASLEKQLKSVPDFKSMEAGNVLIKGGFPGHAAIVMDMAVHSNGRKIYLLAQSYMPAQDIHILRNPNSDELSPWYEINDNQLIHTPEWTFERYQLREW